MWNTCNGVPAAISNFVHGNKFPRTDNYSYKFIYFIDKSFPNIILPYDGTCSDLDEVV